MRRLSRSIVEVGLYVVAAGLATTFFTGEPHAAGIGESTVGGMAPVVGAKRAEWAASVEGAASSAPEDEDGSSETAAPAEGPGHARLGRGGGAPRAGVSPSGPDTAALEAAVIRLFPAAPPSRPPQPPQVAPPEPEAPDDAVDLLWADGREAGPSPPEPQPAPWLSYVGMMRRGGVEYRYFKNGRTERVFEASVGRTIDGYRLVRTPDGRYVVSWDGTSYLVGS